MDFPLDQLLSCIKKEGSRRPFLHSRLIDRLEVCHCHGRGLKSLITFFFFPHHFQRFQPARCFCWRIRQRRAGRFSTRLSKQRHVTAVRKTSLHKGEIGKSARQLPGAVGAQKFTTAPIFPKPPREGGGGGGRRDTLQFLCVILASSQGLR